MADPARLPWTKILSVLAALAAAWAAAGSMGLLAYPMQRTVVWLCLAVGVLCDPQRLRTPPARMAVFVVAVLVGVWMSTSSLAPVNVCAVAFVLVAMNVVRADRLRLAAAQAVAVFAVYQLLLHSVPTVWLVVDRVAVGLGMVVGSATEVLANRPLWVGPTFGGIDFLVLTGALACIWLRRFSGDNAMGWLNGWRRWAIPAAVILAVHFAYLVVLAFAADMEWLLWNTPAVAALLPMVLVGAALRWIATAAVAPAAASEPDSTR